MDLNKIKVLTFANGEYLKSSELLKKHLSNIGVNNFICKTNDDLPSEFMNQFKNLFDNGRGYGYWIWKPYLILNELNTLNNDEILMYIDSSDVPEKKFFELINSVFTKEDSLFVNRGYNHGIWTNMDCFKLMGCANSKYYEAIQLEAGLICLKNTRYNIDLIEEWFDNCKDERKLTDSGNKNPNNLIGFIDHRHDQSILTNLIIKRNIESYKTDVSMVKYNYNQ